MQVITDDDCKPDPNFSFSIKWTANPMRDGQRWVRLKHSHSTLPFLSIRKRFPQTVLAVCVALAVAQAGHTQSKLAKYALTQFDNYGCRAKGRVQDCSGKVMREILADGKDAIPILISQLTETTRTKEQIADYWGDTRSGDVAYVVLTDLFTNSDGQTFEMPGVPDWPTVMKACDKTAQGCWDEYLRKHGRVSVKQAWQRAWDLRKDQIYWESTARCFRVSTK
jgi:hypothetical protein